MRCDHRRVGLIAAVLVGVGVLAHGAKADVTTEQSASILVFPKVIADGTRETVIQITNTSNAMVHAHCFYVNGGLTFPDGPDGIPNSGDEFASPLNPPLWTELDFDIWLTKQQPTYWVVSQGRLVAPDDTCTRDDTACPNAGFDPGRVPPVVENFTGELKCIEVDASGAPLGGNHLKGEATLLTVQQCDAVNGAPGTCRGSNPPVSCSVAADCSGTTGDAAKYNAIGILGLENNDGDGVLCLGGEAGDGCESGPEYNACPQTWILDHLADGAEDPVSGTTSSVDTSITVVPCAEDFETQIPERVTIQFAIVNEFETVFSTSTSVTCWADLELGDIDRVFTRDSVGSDFVQTFMRPATGTNSGFLVVATERHDSDGSISEAASNLHMIGERSGTDKIVIPSEQVAP